MYEDDQSMANALLSPVVSAQSCVVPPTATIVGFPAEDFGLSAASAQIDPPLHIFQVLSLPQTPSFFTSASLLTL